MSHESAPSSREESRVYTPEEIAKYQNMVRQAGVQAIIETARTDEGVQNLVAAVKILEESSQQGAGQAEVLLKVGDAIDHDKDDKYKDALDKLKEGDVGVELDLTSRSATRELRDYNSTLARLRAEHPESSFEELDKLARKEVAGRFYEAIVENYESDMQDRANDYLGTSG